MSICPPNNCGQSREGVIAAVDDGETRRSLDWSLPMNEKQELKRTEGRHYDAPLHQQ